MSKLDQYLKEIKKLPVAPRILAELLSMLRKPDLDSGEVVRLIGFDPGLTTNVLHRCNSATYGLSRPVYDLEEAVVRLGYNQLYSLVAIVIGEISLSGAQDGYGLGPGQLWQHCAAAGIAAKIMAGFCPGDEHLLFTAALLHDIGKLILTDYLEGKYEMVLNETENSGCSLVETERLLLGVDHAELGGQILSDWNFPQSLVSAVRYHHRPLDAAPYEHIASVVCIADLVAHIAGHGFGHQEFAIRADCEPARLLGIDARALENLVLETETAVGQTKLFQRAA
jgi:putative nucleotidyltransferase with HDIG domain